MDKASSSILDAAQQGAMPILVLGQSRRHKLQNQLHSVVQNWIDHWHAADDVKPSINIQLADLMPETLSVPSGSRAVLGSNSTGPQLYVVVPAQVVGSVLGFPRYVSLSSDVTGLANEVLDQIVNSLAQEVRKLCKNELLQSTMITLEANEITKRLSKSHWFYFQIEIASDQNHLLLILVSPEWMQMLSPTPIVKSEQKVDVRRNAIGEELIQLEAVLGEAHVSVGELTSLSVDDVLVLDATLSQLGSLTTRTGQRVATVTVGRVGDKRAVVISK
jgi:Type III flagellar switch regulator (C-ring) FliN C-term